MAVSGEHRPLNVSLPHELTSKTPFLSLKLCFLIGILSLSALSIAFLIYLCIRLSRTSKKRKTLVEETNSLAPSVLSYEVFLSFRGPDNRHEFTDCLYHDMVDAGILVFRDDESLRVGKKIGDELLQAIENCKIYIPIFSKNYAASHWCLQELTHMVDCTSKSDESKEILPIFLDVEPDDVKLKTQLYSKALSKHQKKFCTEAVKSWKRALMEVGKLKGWNRKKDHGQGDLIHSVIQTVLVKLKVAQESVTEHLVGVDDRVEDIIKMLDMESDGVRFLQIHGIGGVGKTTLAQVVFNKLSLNFEGCCFLVDVRESSKSKDGLLNLQKKLLANLLGSQSANLIYQVNDGINMMNRGVLRNKRVLIILDDVDEQEQLDNLAKDSNWFGSGSRIIITTRCNGILVEGPYVLTYEVHEMKFDHALKLFSRHAFRRDHPLDHRISLSKKIVHTSGKLPLALEIIGSFLFDKSEKIWSDTLKKLQEAPPMKVQRILTISYEKLDYAQKEIFLDIACVFVNEDKTYPIYMWDDCNYHPHIAIDVQVLMSLIKIKDDNSFWMHDQVRDLGREIVRQEDFKYPGERSRVWNREEAVRILKQKEGSRKIEVLSVGTRGSFSSREEILTRDEFANLRNLRFFEGKYVSLIGDFKNLLSSLRWLSWHGYDSKFETINFHPTNLVVVDLSFSYISEKWIGWDQIREARKLKVLDLSNCKYLKRTPDLSTWVYLERLVLKGCSNLIEIDHSIVKLKLLTILNLDGCGSLRELPEEIGCLRALTDFVMSPPKEEFERLTISKQPSLKLPYSIGWLEELTRLNLSRCIYIEELPVSVGKLQSLVELDLSSTSIGHLPDSIGNLKQLKVLRMSDMRAIRKLTSAIGLVEKLEELDAQGCCNLTGEIPEEIGRLSRLRILDLSDTLISGLPATLSHLSNLQKLNLEKCPELKQLPELPPSLTCLRWGPKSCWCSFIETREYEPEEFLQETCLAREEYEQGRRRSLEEFGMALCLPIRIGALSQQETLVNALPTSIGTLSQLKTLKLCCKNVQFLPQLPSSLRELQLRDLVTMRSPDFSNLKNLSILTFFRCSLEFSSIFDAESEELRMELCELRQLDAPLQLEMKRLRSLKMAYCEFLPEVLDLSRMKNLERVSLGLCLSLVEIRGLEELGSLRSLSVFHCPSMEWMSDLSKSKKLPKVRVYNCGKLKRQENYCNYGNGEFGVDTSDANSADTSTIDGSDFSSVPDEFRIDAFFGLQCPPLSPLGALMLENLGATHQTLPPPPPSYPGVPSAAPIRRLHPASSDPLHCFADRCGLRLRHRL